MLPIGEYNVRWYMLCVYEKVSDSLKDGGLFYGWSLDGVWAHIVYGVL